MAIRRELIGRDLEEAVTTSNMNVNSTVNIWEQASNLITNGVKTIALSPVKINSLDKFSLWIRRASALNYDTDKLKRNFTQVYETMYYGTSPTTAKPFAFRDEADVEISEEGSGSATEGLQYGATLHFKGDRQYGTVDVVSGQLTFTPITTLNTNNFYDEAGISGRRNLKLFFEYEESEFNAPITN